MKMILWTLLIFIVSVLSILTWASYPWSLGESVIHPAVKNIEPNEMIETDDYPSVIKVLTFNIGFLYGRGSEGPEYNHRGRDYYESSLMKVSQEIKDWGADIVFLQEIDFESSRSHSIDQAEFIAKNAGYPFIAEAPSWDANYIPFPYWPLSNNFGQMKSGGAILSTYPITSHEVTLLAKPKSQPWWYNLFYLHRYFQKVTLRIGDKDINVINLHLEAFDKLDRQLQVTELVHKLKNENIDLVAGDFNMLPTSALKKSKFFNDDEYENDSSFDIMNQSGLSEVIPDDIYQKSESLYFTFPAWAPDRRLDYIWFRPELKMMKAEVLPSASSDHLPLRAIFQISEPRFNPYSQ